MIRTHADAAQPREKERVPRFVLDPLHIHGGEPFLLSDGEWTIGTATPSDFRLPDNGVAAAHCRFLVNGRHIEIAAFDPRTWLNDGPVSRATLRPGDRVVIGPFEFLVREPTAEELPSEPLERIPDEIAGAVAASIDSGTGGEDSRRPTVPSEDSAADESSIPSGSMRDELVRQIDALEQQIEEQQQKLDASVSSARESEHAPRTPDNNSIVSRREAEIERREQTWMAGRRELEKQKLRLEQRESEFATRHGAWQSSIEREKARRAEFERRIDELAALQQHLDERAAAIAASEAELAERLNDVPEQTPSLDGSADVSGDSAQIGERLEAKRHDLTTWEARLEEKEADVTRHAAELEQDRTALIKKQDDYLACIEHLERRQTELDSRERVICERESALEAQQDRFNSEYEQFEQDTQDRLARGLAEVEQLQEQSLREQSEFERRLAAFRDAQREFKTQQDTERSERATARRRIERRESALNDSTSELMCARLEIEQERDELDRWRRDLRRQQRELDEQRTAYEGLHLREAALQEQERQMKETECALLTQTETLQTEWSALREEQDKVAQRDEEQAEQSRKLAQREHALKTAEAALAAESEARDAYQAAEQLKEQVARERRELERAIAKNDERGKELDKQRAELEAERDALDTERNALADDEATQAATRDELDRREHELNETEEMLIARERELTQRQTQLDSDVCDIEELRNVLTNTEAALAAGREEMDRERELILDEQNRLKEEQAELVQRESEFSWEQSAAAETRSKVQDQLAAVENERSQLANERESLQQDRTTFKSEVQRVVADLQQQTASHPTEVPEANINTPDLDDAPIGLTSARFLNWNLADGAPREENTPQETIEPETSTAPADEEDDVTQSVLLARAPATVQNHDEVRANLDSMRDLANQSARAAVAQHSWKQVRSGLVVRCALAVATMVVAALLFVAVIFEARISGLDSLAVGALALCGVSLLELGRWVTMHFWRIYSSSKRN